MLDCPQEQDKNQFTNQLIPIMEMCPKHHLQSHLLESISQSMVTRALHLFAAAFTRGVHSFLPRGTGISCQYFQSKSFRTCSQGSFFSSSSRVAKLTRGCLLRSFAPSSHAVLISTIDTISIAPCPSASSLVTELLYSFPSRKTKELKLIHDYGLPN